jgi:hypothetical protein
MTITFENDNDVIVHALEKVISYARRTQQIFVAQCVWWLASIIGLEQGLIIHIDNLQERTNIGRNQYSENVDIPGKDIEIVESSQDRSAKIHPDRVPQIAKERAVSTVPRDLTEDQRLDRILESAERVIQESLRGRTVAQQGRVNTLPTTKTQLKKARKIKRLQEEERKREAERSQRLREIRATVIRNLSKE